MCISETALQKTPKIYTDTTSPHSEVHSYRGYHGMAFVKHLYLGKVSVLCGIIDDFLFLQRPLDSNKSDPATNLISDAIFHSYPTIPRSYECCYIYNKRALSCFCCHLANELCALNAAPKLK